VRGEVDDRRPNRGRDEMQRAMESAREIDRFFARGRAMGGLRDEWRELKQDLNQLARFYNLGRV